MQLDVDIEAHIQTSRHDKYIKATVGQRNYFTIFFHTSRQFHIIISGINNGLFNASCDLEGIVIACGKQYS